MTDLRLHEALREIELLRARNRELEDRIRAQEEDVLAGDIDGAEIQNRLAELRAENEILWGIIAKRDGKPELERLGDCYGGIIDGFTTDEEQAQFAAEDRQQRARVREALK